MANKNKYFLKTGMTLRDTSQLLIKKLKPMLDECMYNVNRYNAPISLILLYTEDDIKDVILEYKRLTDGLNTIKIEGSYFNFIFLPFTDLEDSFSLINHLEYNIKTQIKIFSSAAKIESKIHSYNNFINSYLHEISEQDKGNVLSY